MTEAEALLDTLDAEQREVATSLVGPVRVLAGAGTGKTRAITTRIAYGVASGAFDPNRVLALSFTVRAAGEMRARLRAQGAVGVAARTFHSAAMSQLNYFWPQLAGGAPPAIIDGKARTLAHAAERIGLRVDTATLRDLAAEIEWRKVRALSIEEYAAQAAESRVMPANVTPSRMLDLMVAYERLKDERRAIDFEDVILIVTGMLRAEEWVASSVRSQYRFFVVDEFQDVSPLQLGLLNAWLGTRRELCVVGDASQTIYSFAGASSEPLLTFSRRFPDATLIDLVRNYRSTPAIVETANALMRERAGALQLRAQDAEDAGEEPRIRAFESDDDEAIAIATELASWRASGRSLGDAAILIRTNAQSASIERALSVTGIPYRVHGDKRFFDREEVRQAVMALRGAAVSADDRPLFQSVSDVLRSLGWTQHPPEEQGARRNRWTNLDALMTLADAQPAGTTLREFSAELLSRQEAHAEPRIEQVTIATLHSAKGLEWPLVWIAGMSEGLLPISYARTREAIDEERRLAYVGITRSRESLVMSWSRGSGRREASRFLGELHSRTRGVGGEER